MDRERLDDWCEKGILGLIGLVLIWGPLATGAVRIPDWLVIQFVTIGVALLWGIRVWIRPSYRFLWPPTAWLVLAFVGYALVRYQTATIEYVARDEWIHVLVYGLIFFAILDNLNRQDWVQGVSFALIFLAMAVSAYAIYQLAAKSPMVWYFEKPAQYWGRGSGTYICPNHLAGFLELILPVGLAFALVGRLNHVFKVVLGYASLMMLAGVAVTLSRGGWVTTFLALLLFFGFLLKWRETRIRAIACLVVLAIAGVVVAQKASNPTKRFEKMVTEEGTVDEIRFALWKPAVNVWQDHLWLGGGPGHFDYLFRRYRPAHVQLRPMRAHNDYLNVLADWGLVGALLVAGALGSVAYALFRSWRFLQRSNDLRTRMSNRSAFVLGAGVGLAAILIHSFVDFNMYIPGNAMIAVAWMAFLSGHLRYASDRYWKKPGIVGRVILTLVLAVSSGYLGWQGWVRFQEYALLQNADHDAPRELQWLEAAYSVAPTNFDTTYRIGEMHRLEGTEGVGDFKKELQTAMEWFQKGMELNPFESINFLKYGICLDWLGRHDEAGPYFDQALKVDPNSYYVLALLGWHVMQTGDLEGAKNYFERSNRFKWQNPEAAAYLRVIRQRLAKPGMAGAR